MPAAEAMKLSLTFRGSPPPCPTTPSSFIDNTGSTHGIRLRIRPPSTPKARITASEVSAFGIATAAAGFVVSTGNRLSAPRSPSTSVTVINVPGSGFSRYSAPITPTSRTALRSSRSRITRGDSKASSAGPSMKTSGAENGVIEVALMSNRVSPPVPTIWTGPRSRPWALPSPGTRLR